MICNSTVCFCAAGSTKLAYGTIWTEAWYLSLAQPSMMTASLSKRHQARNERNLQELIKTVPGNDRCADCQARNPGNWFPPQRLWNLIRANSWFQDGQAGTWAHGQSSAQWKWLTVGIRLARHLPMHAMRLITSKARHSHIQSEIA